ncbi:hypothetical protein HMPREF9554_01490 [Treponema phagedenis F0421]|nr:hypothetical protein HMPREF9554_01490 [Treponema phagedenis F0421]
MRSISEKISQDLQRSSTWHGRSFAIFSLLRLKAEFKGQPPFVHAKPCLIA